MYACSMPWSMICLENWLGVIFIAGRIPSTTDLIHKSDNLSVPYPTMLQSEQKCAHFYFVWSIVGYGMGAFWDLWNWSIDDLLFRERQPWAWKKIYRPVYIMSLNDNRSALVQVIDWRRTGNKTLSETMIDHMHDAICRHKASVT